MTNQISDDRANMMLNAALDGELDAMGVLEFERALASDSKLAARYDQLMTLRGAMRASAGTLRAPDALRARIEAMAKQEGTERGAASARPRVAMAAAIALAFVAGATGANIASRLSTPLQSQIAMLLVDDHRRALLAAETIDVASSDRHTVKPWFDARLALSPPVVDLSAQGFVLVGGRADVVEGTPVPTIVYRIREHFISLTALPAARFATSAAPGSINGYETQAWSDAGFVYWAVSDLPRPDLDSFAAAFRAGAAANTENH